MDKKLMANLLVLSIGVNIVTMAAIVDQQKTIESFKTYKRRMTTWAKIMTDAIEANYASGNRMDLPKAMWTNIDAYLIMRENDLD